MEKITLKEKRVLEFIIRRIKEDGFPPTIREIGRAFGFSSTGTVRDYLRNLSRKGYIKIFPSRARGIVPLGLSGIPVVGKIPAGIPEIPVEEIESYLRIEEIGEENVFALKVKGESMTGKGILPGDIVIVRPQPTAEDGDIVVAVIGEEATVKTLRKERKNWYLESAHPSYPPIPLSENARIVGKVIGVWRDYRRR